MTIRTRLKRGYKIRQVVIALVCVVLGLWGIYDYVWTIPNRFKAFDRKEICLATVDVLETDPLDKTFKEKTEATLALIETGLDELTNVVDVDESEPDLAPATEQEALNKQVKKLKETIESLDAQGQLGWFQALLLFRQALTTTRPMATSQASLTGIHAAAWEVASQGVKEFEEVSEPRSYDRIIKGLVFIPCLPYGLYMLVPLWLKSRKRYELDEEGNLHLAGGEVWSRDQIKDIDMSKWMSKSIARVEHVDGKVVKLDDYFYQDMHLIIGSLAHRFDPEQWHEDGKKVKDETDDEADEADAGDEPVEGVDMESERGEINDRT